MKKFYFTLVSLTVMTFLILQVGLAAEKIVQSGDATIDQNMKEMNAKARENLKEFSLRTGKQFGVSPEVVDELMKERKMSPADAHMALNVAKTSRRPVEEVADVYERGTGKDWGAIAREMGIKPGSAEFHELKANSKSGHGEDAEIGKSKGKGKDKSNKKVKGKGKGKGKKK